MAASNRAPDPKSTDPESTDPKSTDPRSRKTSGGLSLASSGKWRSCLKVTLDKGAPRVVLYFDSSKRRDVTALSKGSRSPFDGRVATGIKRRGVLGHGDVRYALNLGWLPSSPPDRVDRPPFKAVHSGVVRRLGRGGPTI